jgi:hypothetical protein
VLLSLGLFWGCSGAVALLGAVALPGAVALERSLRDPNGDPEEIQRLDTSLAAICQVRTAEGALGVVQSGIV